MSYTLLVASKAYSSWSLRGWLLFDAFSIPVTEQVVPMYSDAFHDALAAMAPARTVPCLAEERNGARIVIWDSLAIAEHLAERHPEAGHLPADPVARAAARSLTAEMHSGFSALRGAMPMALHHRLAPKPIADDVSRDIARIEALWSSTRAQHGAGGPYLFGAAYTMADAFFTPVASRFETYAVPLSSESAAYRDALLVHPSVVRWREQANLEPEMEKRYGFA
ncbi:MAG: glutathione S-transferase [Pseudomonadota bacterium]